MANASKKQGSKEAKPQRKNSAKNKISKKKMFDYSHMSMINAVKAVHSGMLVLQASNTFKVPRSTLHDKLSGRSSIDAQRIAPDPVLGIEIETVLEDWLLETCKMGIPMNKENLIISVKQIIQAENLNIPYFMNNMPGKGWFQRFMKRHPRLSQKKENT